MWRLALVMLVGCGGGQSPEPDAPDPLETSPITPLICTTQPGDSSCLVNFVPLVGAPGSEVQFVAQIVAAMMFVQNVTFVAGPAGLHIEHPLLLGLSDMFAPSTIDLLFSDDDRTLDLAPGETRVVSQFVSVGEGPRRIAFRFAAIGPTP